jgi:hypothetical protein
VVGMKMRRMLLSTATTRNSRQFLIAKRMRRDVLLVVLEKAKQKYPFRLYGVCLMANIFTF